MSLAAEAPVCVDEVDEILCAGEILAENKNKRCNQIIDLFEKNN